MNRGLERNETTEFTTFNEKEENKMIDGDDKLFHAE